MNDTLSSRLPFQPSQINETLSPPPPPPCDGVMFEAFRGGPTAAPRSSCLSPCPVLFWAPGTGDMGGLGVGHPLHFFIFIALTSGFVSLLPLSPSSPSVILQNRPPPIG